MVLIRTVRVVQRSKAGYVCQHVQCPLLTLTAALEFCSYRELSELCNGLDPEQLFRQSTRTFKGRMRNQDSSSQDVMIQWQCAAADLAERASSSFVDWLDGMSQLEHPHVLPIIGACADPPATVAPFLPVCRLSPASMLPSLFT